MFAMRKLTITDLEAVNQFCLTNPNYFILESGIGAEASAAQDIFESLPPGKTQADKFVEGFYLDDRLVGIAEGIRDYPSAGTWIIGLFIVAEAARSQALGGRFLAMLEAELKAAGAEALRIGVLDINPAGMRFWEKQGYRRTGETKDMPFGNHIHRVHVLIKDVSAE